MSRSTEQAIKIANEYREAMLLLGIKRGMSMAEAAEFAARCALEQVIKRDEMQKRAEAKRKLRK